MSEATDQDLPPLGEPTPPPQTAPASRVVPRRTAAAVAIGLVIGLLMGFGAGFGVGGGMDDDRTTTTGRQPPGDRATDDVPPTSEDALPQECVATMRSAQQTLALVDQALRDLRALNLAEVDRAAREVERLRGGLGEEVRQCLEKMGE